jgi:dTDP-4-dehydrorhamnose reductase
MLPVWLFGGTSMIGWHVIRSSIQGLEVFCNRFAKFAACRDWRRINLDDADDVQALFASAAPRYVICCAGICDVDKCETDPDWAYRINVDGIVNLLANLPATTRFVYCSSDHVFSGDTGPYDEASDLDPITVYGQTRKTAEALIREARPDALIVRAGPVIGDSVDSRTGYLDWLRYRHREGLPITVVEDEARSAVSGPDLATRIVALTMSDCAGIRHVAAPAVSRLELAMYLNREYEIGADIAVERRVDRLVPHIGRIELTTLYDDALVEPLQLIP